MCGADSDEVYVAKIQEMETRDKADKGKNVTLDVAKRR